MNGSALGADVRFTLKPFCFQWQYVFYCYVIAATLIWHWNVFSNIKTIITKYSSLQKEPNTLAACVNNLEQANMNFWNRWKTS